MTLRKTMSRSLKFECMEDRLALAGNLQAAVHGGDLVLTGDAAANEIAIYRGANANQVIVAGVDSGDGPTRVNNTLRPVVLNGFTGSIVGSLNGGNDRVGITNLRVPGSVILNGNNGDDQIVLSNGFGLPAATLNDGKLVPVGNITVGRDVLLFLGDGLDRAVLVDVNVGDDVELHGQSGNDDLSVIGSRGRAIPRIADTLLFFPGTGDDVVNSAFLKVGGFLEVHDTEADFGGTVLLSQVTVNKDLNIYMSPENDFVSILARVGDFNAYLGDGDDALSLRLPASLDSYVNTGSGNDNVVIFDTTARHATIDTGAGDDELTLIASSARTFKAYLGRGNDSLTAQLVTVSESAYVDGGEGNDLFFSFGGNNINRFERHSI